MVVDIVLLLARPALARGIYESIEHCYRIGRLRDFNEIVATTELSISNDIVYTPTTIW
ncbi:MAG: hypothetical protein JKY48_07370 [Flavobacteriales bacterium]|nr:hypothetical protein [Flavobacteriales bacterium]